jgi:hypothetical protein
MTRRRRVAITILVSALAGVGFLFFVALPLIQVLTYQPAEGSGALRHDPDPARFESQLRSGYPIGTELLELALELQSQDIAYEIIMPTPDTMELRTTIHGPISLLEPVRQDYAVWFVIDANGCIEEVRIEEQLTGP